MKAQTMYLYFDLLMSDNKDFEFVTDSIYSDFFFRTKKKKPRQQKKISEMPFK